MRSWEERKPFLRSYIEFVDIVGVVGSTLSRETRCRRSAKVHVVDLAAKVLFLGMENGNGCF